MKKKKTFKNIYEELLQNVHTTAPSQGVSLTEKSLTQAVNGAYAKMQLAQAVAPYQTPAQRKKTMSQILGQSFKVSPGKMWMTDDEETVTVKVEKKERNLKDFLDTLKD